MRWDSQRPRSWASGSICRPQHGDSKWVKRIVLKSLIKGRHEVWALPRPQSGQWRWGLGTSDWKVEGDGLLGGFRNTYPTAHSTFPRLTLF